jgi:hypothetical protein
MRFLENSQLEPLRLDGIHGDATGHSETSEGSDTKSEGSDLEDGDEDFDAQLLAQESFYMRVCRPSWSLKKKLFLEDVLER